MKHSVTILGIVMLACVVSVSTALASPMSAFRPNFFRDVPSTSNMLQEGQAQLAPLPFVVFCMQYPTECKANSSASSIELTPEKLAELNEVNARINNGIRPQEDTSVRRLWKLDVDAGDCNEYAVQKRHELIKAGWPAAALSLTVAKTAWGEGHLLVTVRTDHGDLLLDSLQKAVVTSEQAHYHWIMRQSAADLTTWVAIEAPTTHHRYHGSSTTPHHARPDTTETMVNLVPPIGSEPVTGRLIRL